MKNQLWFFSLTVMCFLLSVFSNTVSATITTNQPQLLPYTINNKTYTDVVVYYQDWIDRTIWFYYNPTSTSNYNGQLRYTGSAISDGGGPGTSNYAVYCSQYGNDTDTLYCDPNYAGSVLFNHNGNFTASYTKSSQNIYGLSGNSVVMVANLASGQSAGNAKINETFENFSIGPIDGQGNWTSVVLTDRPNSIAEVVSSPTHSGSQSLRLSGFASNATYTVNNPVPTNSSVIVSFWYREQYGFGTNDTGKNPSFFIWITVSDGYNLHTTYVNICHAGVGHRSVLMTANSIGNGSCINGVGDMTEGNWYFIEVEYDFENRIAHARVDGGNWGSNINVRVNGGANGSYITSLFLMSVWDNPPQFWFDDFRQIGSALQKKVVFIPGFLGSRLYRKNDDGTAGDRLWETACNGDIEYLMPNSDGSFNSDRPVTLKAKSYSTGKSDHGIVDWLQAECAPEGDDLKYQYLIDFLDSTVGTQNWKAVPWDWRLSLDEAAENLQSEIDQMAAQGTGKVVLITHSTGGLLARAYLKKYGSEKVERFISVAAPHLGTPIAFRELLHGDREIFLNGLVPQSLWRQIGSRMYSAHQLLPTQESFEIAQAYKDLGPVYNTKLPWSLQLFQDNCSQGWKFNIPD